MEYQRQDFENIPIKSLVKWMIPIGAVILILYAIGSTAYKVNQEEEAAVLRFGKFIETVGPGLHFKIPFGIDKAIIVSVKKDKKEEFGFRTVSAGVQSQITRNFKAAQKESLMLTGDLNCAVVEWIVRYRIKNLEDYLFNVRNLQSRGDVLRTQTWQGANSTVRDVSEAVMRSIIGDRSVDEAITIGRAEIALKAKEQIQAMLNKYECGIKVIEVALRDVTPPGPVRPAFDEVNQAQQDKDKVINEAQAERNAQVPAARGERERMIKQAEGYLIKRKNEATGEANAFIAVWKEYEVAKDVTRRRLYLETISAVLPKIGRKFIIDQDQEGVLQLLNLSEKGGAK